MAISVVADKATPRGAVTERRNAVVVRGLRKRYGGPDQYVDALLGVDLQVGAGEIVGVLGPNGAGKTTLIEILEGLRTPDAGTAEVLGIPLSARAQLKRNRARMGISLQHSVLPPLVTVEELLAFQRVLFAATSDIGELIAAVGLQDKRSARVQHLSGGQQQRVAVAMALVGDPELMFLDEPTSQLDPVARRSIWNAIGRQRARRDAAVILTTHQMDEAQALCDRVFILDGGRVIAQGAPRELIDRYCGQRIVEFLVPLASDLQFIEEKTTREETSDGCWRVRVEASDVNGLIAELMQRQRQGRLAAQDVRIDQQTLEDVFLKLTGRRIREE